MSDTTNSLVLERVLDAPRQNIWRCWTEAALLEPWFCPKPWYVTDARVDPRPGGEFSCVMHGPNGEAFPHMGVFLEVVSGEKIVTTDAFLPGWIPSGRAFMSAEVILEDSGDGKTRYTATARHWSAEDKEEHEKMGFHEGWGAVADQLEAFANTL